MYIIVDFGIICLIIGIVLIGGIAAGTLILEKVIDFFFGPLRVGLIILFLLIVAASIAVGFTEKSKYTIPSRVIGTTLNTTGSILRWIVNIVFVLCILQGFLLNMEEEKVFWAAFAIVSDGLVFLLLFALSLAIDGLVLRYSNNAMILIGSLNVVLSVMYFMICQELLIHFYEGAVLELFLNQKWLSNFILNSWFSALFGL